MKWVRANIGLGARVALFALAVQFVLSFGHFHPIAAQAAPSILSVQQQLPAPGPDQDRHLDDVCAICAVIALASTAIAAVIAAAAIHRIAATNDRYGIPSSARGARRVSIPRTSPLLIPIAA
jgi:hypothetical protein